MEFETKLEGLDSLELEELERAIANLDGDIANVTFDPNAPQSIEQAIQELNTVIDERVMGYSKNEMVASIVKELKEQFREEILDRASAARLAGEDEK